MSQNVFRRGLLVLSIFAFGICRAQFKASDPIEPQEPLTVYQDSSFAVNVVLNNYLKAIGGIDKIRSLKSIKLVYETQMQGSTFASEEKRMPDKLAQNIYLDGSLIMSVITTQEEVYMDQSGTRTQLGEALGEDMKLLAGLVLELNLLESDRAVLSGTESVEGVMAYRVDVPGTTNSLSLFYDIETGFKIKEIQITRTNGAEQVQEAYLSDYKSYEGVMFPTLRRGVQAGQNIRFTLTELKLNEGVKETDFD